MKDIRLIVLVALVVVMALGGAFSLKLAVADYPTVHQGWLWSGMACLVLLGVAVLATALRYAALDD